jgi:hypothetical protein
MKTTAFPLTQKIKEILLVTSILFLCISLLSGLSCKRVTLKISKEKAIKIASNVLESHIVSGANINAEYVKGIGPNGAWMITFKNIEVTRNQLISVGWDKNDNNTLFSPEDSYTTVLINVDTKTGDILTKIASNLTFYIGPP